MKSNHKLAILLSLLLVLSPLALMADLKKFENSKLGFSLAYSPQFEAIPATMAEIAVLLRHKDGSYPTFNVLLEDCSPGLLDLEASEQGQRLKSDYGRVGLLSAEVLEAQKLVFSGHKAFSASILYSNQGTDYKSNVLRILSSDGCFVLTYIDLAASFEERRFMLNQLHSGFQIKFDGPGKVPEQSNSGLSYSAFLLGLTTFLVALYFLKRRLRIPK